MKFSIVIPCYNEEKYLGECLKSILSLNWPKEDLEIIVVNNNSTDRTREIAEEIGVDKIIDEINPGANRARAAGVQNAGGEIICFLDADCLLPENWLLSIAEAMKGESAAAVGGPYDYCFSGWMGRLSLAYQNLIMPNFARFLSFVFRRPAGVLNGGNCAVKKESLDKIGGLNTKLAFAGDDADLAIRLAGIGQVLWSKSLVVKTSPRRFEKEGILRTAGKYALNYLGIYFLRRPIISQKAMDED